MQHLQRLEELTATLYDNYFTFLEICCPWIHFCTTSRVRDLMATGDFFFKIFILFREYIEKIKQNTTQNTPYALIVDITLTIVVDN